MMRNLKTLIAFLFVLLTVGVFAQAPVITSFSPSNGPAGTLITIVGSGFDPLAENNIVSIGGVNVKVVSATDKLLTVKVLSSAISGQIRAVNLSEGLSAVSFSDYHGSFARSFPVSAADFVTRVGTKWINSADSYDEVRLADFDGDGLPDILRWVYTSSKITIGRNTSESGKAGSDVFLEQVISDPSNTNTIRSVAVGDLNNDGKPDLVVSTSGSNLSVYLNNSTTGRISLEKPFNLTKSESARCIAISDCDNDGRNEILACSEHFISIFKNTGGKASTLFSTAVEQYLSDPDELIVRDIDGDRLPELIIMRSYGSTYILKNKSAGGAIKNDMFEFLTSLNEEGSVNTPTGTSIAVEDLNADNKPDIIISNAYTREITVCEITTEVGALARNSFKPTKLNFGIPLSGVSVKDLDGDGLPDLLCADNYSHMISYLKNLGGSGFNFASQINLKTGQYPREIQVTDLNADGINDIVTNHTGGLSIIVQRPVVVFPPTIKQFTPLNGTPGTIVKLSGTNFAAAVSSNIVKFGGVTALVNSASPTQLTVTVPNGASTEFITVLNDSTGLQAKSSIPFISSFKGKGSMVKSDFAFRVGFESDINLSTAHVTDLDGDGLNDIIAGYMSEPGFLVLQNQLEGTHINGQTFVKSLKVLYTDSPVWAGSTTVSSGDLNADGKPDLIIGNGGMPFVSVYVNQSEPGKLSEYSFGRKIDFNLSAGVTDLVATDVDLDGKVDIVVTYGVGGLGVLRNISFGKNIAFAESVNFQTGYVPRDLLVRDIDGDGKPELIVANDYSKTISVYRNKAVAGDDIASYFAAKVDFATEKEPGALAVDDLDGDGKPELIVGYSESYEVSVYKNTSIKGRISTTSFAARKQFNAGDNVFGLYVADLDGDIYSDIVSASASFASVLKNKSSGTDLAVDKALVLADLYSYSYDVTCADFNNDGRADILTCTGTNICVKENIAGYTSKPPAIKTISPLIANTGTPVRITGENLSEVNQVTFGNINSRSVYVESDTSIVAVVGNAASGDVKVNTFAGAATKSGFIYKAPPAVKYLASTLSLPRGTSSGILPLAFGEGKGIEPLLPLNTGGAVPEALYGEVSDFAGKGLKGFADGKDSLAMFNDGKGVVCDGNGNLFVADTKNNRIRKIDKNGEVSTYAGSQSAGWVDGKKDDAKFNEPTGLAFAPDGTLYVADAGNHMVRKISASGIVSTVAGNLTPGWLDSTGTLSRFNSPTAISVDRYGTLYVADRNNHCVRKISSNGKVSTFAGSTNSGHKDGRGSDAEFNNPVDLFVDESLDVYVSDAGNNRIKKINRYGLVITIAGSGKKGNKDGGAVSAEFNSPAGISVDTAGNIYVSDAGNYKLRKISKSGFVSTLAGDDIPGTENGMADARFTSLAGICNEGGRYAYVYDNNKIRKVSLVGFRVSPELPKGISIDIQGRISGTAIQSQADGVYNIIASNVSGFSENQLSIAIEKPEPAQKLSFYYNGPWMGKAGAVMDTLKPVIQGWKEPVNVLGKTSTYAGSLTAGNTDGNLSAARFRGNKGIAIDADGNLIIADAGNNLIRKITPAGIVTTLAGNGAAGWKDGVALQASFDKPSGIAIDKQGNIYIADAGNNRIRLINKDGIVSTYAGNGSYAYTNGPVLSASFKYPVSVAVNARGDLYVADIYNSCIRKISKEGVVSRVLANPEPYSSWYPSAVFVNSKDSVFVCDFSKLYKLRPDGTALRVPGEYNGGNAITEDNAGNLYLTKGSQVIVIAGEKGPQTIAGGFTEGSTDGVGTLATFKNLSGVVYSNGFLFACDTDNNLVRKIGTEGFICSPPLPPGLSIDPANGNLSGKSSTILKSGKYRVMALAKDTSISTPLNIALIDGTQNIPFIKNVYPNAAAIGDVVKIAGFNFNSSSNKNVVYFGDTRAMVLASTTEELTVRVPAGATYKIVSVIDSVSGLSGYSRLPFTPIFKSKKSIQKTDFDKPVSLKLSGTDSDAHVKTGDFDNDGKTDIAIFHNFKLKIYRNMSAPGTLKAGDFVLAYTFDETGYGQMVVEDMDGDGRLDLVTANRYSDSLSAYRNVSTSGKISFVRDVKFKTDVRIWGISSGDMDRNGKIDICASSFPDNKVSMFTNKSVKGKIVLASYYFTSTVKSGLGDLNVADLDNDGWLDISLNAFADSAITILRSQSEISCCVTQFEMSRIKWPQSNAEIIGADFDVDGKVDLLATSWTGIGIFKNTSAPGKIDSSSYSSAIQYLPWNRVNNIEVADVDGDGLVDLIGNDYSYLNIAILRNASERGSLIKSSFSPQITLSGIAHNIHSADMDGDGKVDIITLNGNEVLFFRNNPKEVPVLEVTDGSSIYEFAGKRNFISNPIDSGVVLNYAGNAPISKATVGISGKLSKAEDRLVFSPDIKVTGNISGLYNQETGILTLNSAGNIATAWQWQAALRAVAYQNLNRSNPNVSDRTVQFTAYVDTLGSIPSAKLIDVNFYDTPQILNVDRKLFTRGSKIEIYGKNLNTVNSVSIGGKLASFTIKSASLITAVAGDGNSGNLEINGTEGKSELSGFVYVAPPTITAGSATHFRRGDSVILNSSSITSGAWQWQKNGLNIIASKTNRLVVTEAGNYNVILLVGDLLASSDTISTSLYFGLPENNFKVLARGLTCNNTTDGKIIIESAQAMGYHAKIKGSALDTVFNFSKDLTISNLTSGIYNVEIGVNGETGFKRNYELTVSAPPELKLQSTVSGDSLLLVLSGSDQYFIQLNGKEYITNSSNWSQKLTANTNYLEVSSDRSCQGSIKRTINDSRLSVFPNPFTNLLGIDIEAEDALVDVIDLSGTKKYSATHRVFGKHLQLDLSFLETGVYLLNVTTPQGTSTVRILKK